MGSKVKVWIPEAIGSLIGFLEEVEVFFLEGSHLKHQYVIGAVIHLSHTLRYEAFVDVAVLMTLGAEHDQLLVQPLLSEEVLDGNSIEWHVWINTGIIFVDDAGCGLTVTPAP